MDRSAINEQIDRILNSQTFANKSQLRKLLDVLSRNMDTQATLKPDRVITELWPEEVRTKGSADVATEMNRLRHALDSYYDGEGKADSIIIRLPKRSPAIDGRQEKRWIAATPRNGNEDRRLIRLVHANKGVKIGAAAAVVCVAAYISLRMLAAHPHPAFGRMEGSTLRIMDAEGKELWSKNFPEGFAGDWYYAEGVESRIWFGDLEGNGQTDVLFLYLPGISPQSHSTTLICYSDRGKEKWRWTPGKELPELHETPATYKTAALKVLKAPSRKPSRIVVSSMHDPWWPNQIAILDANGKTISEYWHSGHFGSMTLADLEGDGKQEIIAAGISNGYHQATLVVLDPDRVFGASTEATRPELQIHGMGVAQERLRLLFPRSDMNKALYPYNEATEPTIEHGNVRLAVRECLIPAGCPVWYEFDRHFDLITAYASDQFRSAHARFYENSKGAHAVSAQEQASFQNVRCLAGCKSEYVQLGK